MIMRQRKLADRLRTVPDRLRKHADRAANSALDESALLETSDLSATWVWNRFLQHTRVLVSGTLSEFGLGPCFLADP